MRDALTQERLHSLLAYEPLSGLFLRKVKTSNNVVIGEIAGSKQKTGYYSISVDGIKYLAHRLAFLYMTGRWPTNQIDHVNGRRGDNRWANLREATNSQNAFNKKARNKVGIKNVYFHPQSGLYNVKLTIDGCTTSFGYFKDIELAELVAIGAREKYHKEYHTQ